MNNSADFEHSLTMPKWIAWIPMVIPLGILIAILDTGASGVVAIVMFVIAAFWGALLTWMLYASYKRQVRTRKIFLDNGILSCKFLRPTKINLRDVAYMEVDSFLSAQTMTFRMKNKEVERWSISPKLEDSQIETLHSIIGKYRSE